MSEFIFNLDMTDSEENTNYIKEQILTVIENFHVTVEQLPILLGVSFDKINKILQGEPCELNDEEEHLMNHRLTFLSIGFSNIDANERIKLIINSMLINEYHFSHASLAKFANVPYDVFKNFCDNDVQIEPKYLLNICVNLLMLYFILNNNPTDSEMVKIL